MTENHKNNTFAIANYIIENAGQITNLKLQKLLFFSYAVYSCVYDDRLFMSTIEAWKLGPVVKDVYDVLRIYGDDVISKKINVADEEGISDNPILTNKSEQQAVKIALLYYGKFTTWELVEKTHEFDCWKNHFNKNGINSEMVFDEIKAEFDAKEMPNIVKFINNI